MKIRPLLFVASFLLASTPLTGLGQEQSFLNWSTTKDLGRPAKISVGKIIKGGAGYYACSTAHRGTPGQTMVLTSYNADSSVNWVRQFPGRAWDVVATASGVYLAGAQRQISQASNMTLLRYDPNGNLQWYRNYMGSSYPTDPVRVGVDASGNAVLVGSQWTGSTIDRDYLVRKVSAEGLSVWTSTYTTSLNDVVSDFSIDAGGNVVVTGSTGAGSSWDVLTVRFSPTGALLWARTYDAGYATIDGGTAVVTDGSGGVVVGATLKNSTSAVLLSYAVDGTPGWTTQLPNFGAVHALKLSSTGSLAVSGKDSAGTDLMRLARLNSSGAIQWNLGVADLRFTEAMPFGLAIDELDGMYAVGRDATNHMVMAKANSAGALVWANTLANPATPNTGISVALDDPNGVIALGNYAGGATDDDAVLLHTDRAGGNSTQQTAEYGGSMDVVEASATDAAGNTYVVGEGGSLGSSGAVAAIVKFNPTGSVSWSRTISGPGVFRGLAVTLTPSGNIAMAGSSSDPATGVGFLRLYNPAGGLVWTTTLGTKDVPVFVRCDSAANVLVGSTDNSAIPSLTVTKVSPAGTLLWRTVRPGTSGRGDKINGMAVDTAGTVYLAGLTEDSGYLFAILTKFDSTGALDWSKDGGFNDDFFDVQVDSSGRPHVIGSGGLYQQLGFCRQYDTDGNVVWATTLDYQGFDTAGYSGAFDAQGNVLVTGVATVGAPMVATFKLSPAGAILWAKTYGSAWTQNGSKIAVDPSGAIYVAGNSTTFETARDYILIKYSPDGDLLWPASGDVFVSGGVVVDNDTHTENFLRGFGMDSKGGLYLAGSSYGPNGSKDFNVAKVGPVDNSVFVSQTVPATMTAGQTYQITMTFTNTGNTTWTKALNFKLASRNPADTKAFGLNRVLLADGDVIAPGQSKTFKFNVNAPVTAGVYNFQWKMLHDGIGTFGQDSLNVPVNVSVGSYAARYVSQVLPVSVKAGTTFSYKVTMRNVGSTTWVPANVVLRATPFPGTFGMSSASLNSGESVVQGQDRVFTITLTAPASPGTYTITRWRMYLSGTAVYFGDTSTSKSIVVTP